jgi:hypothetical protein
MFSIGGLDFSNLSGKVKESSTSKSPYGLPEFNAAGQVVLPKSETSKYGVSPEAIAAAQKGAPTTSKGNVLDRALSSVNAGAQKGVDALQAAARPVTKAVETAARPVQQGIQNVGAGMKAAVAPIQSAVQNLPNAFNNPLGPLAGVLGQAGTDISSWWKGDNIGGPDMSKYMMPDASAGGGTGNAGFTSYDPARISAPTMGFTAAQDRSQYTPQQANLIEMLMARSQGTGGPSPAELMLAQQNQQNINNAMALNASQSGRAMPVALRQIQQQQALGAQQAAQQAAIMRAQEMLNAQGQAATALQSARGTDLDLARFNQQQMQAARERDFNAGLEAAKTNEANRLAASGQNLAWGQTQAQSDVAKRGQDVALRQSALQAENETALAKARRQDDLIKGLLGGAASAGASYLGGK